MLSFIALFTIWVFDWETLLSIVSDNEYTEPNTSKLAVLVVVSSVESLFFSNELLVSDDLFFVLLLLWSEKQPRCVVLDFCGSRYSDYLQFSYQKRKSWEEWRIRLRQLLFSISFSRHLLNISRKWGCFVFFKFSLAFF